MDRCDAPTQTRRREAEDLLRRELKKRYPDLAGIFKVRLTLAAAKGLKYGREESGDYVDW